MTLAQAMGLLDHARPGNQLGDEEKLLRLSELDGKVFNELICSHEGDDQEAFHGYDQQTDMDTVTLIPEPYSIIYLRWLESCLDYMQGEMDRYNNSSAAFNQAYSEFSAWYTRTHMPVQKGPFNV